MEPGNVRESLSRLNTMQLAQLRNHLLSQDVASLGLSADQAMSLLQAIEELDTRDVQPNFAQSQSVPGFPVPQQPVHTDLDMPKVISNINRLFLSAFGSPGGGDNSVVYQPVSELSAINERVQMLEMQRARILSAQKQEQQNMQSALGDGSAWTGPNPKRRMIANDGTSFNEVQGFQGNWMQGDNQNSQMNQSTVQMDQPRAQTNQSGSEREMNQSRGRGRAKMIRGGFANTKRQSRARRKVKKKGRGGPQWRSLGRSEPRDDSYRRQSADEEDYYDRRSRSRESVGRDWRDNSNERGRSYDRRSHDGDGGDEQGYPRGRREGSRNRDTDSHEKRYHEQDDGYGCRSDDDSRSYQDEGRSYQSERRSYEDESQPYPESPRGDGYFRSKSNDFPQDDQLDGRGDRHGRKRKHRDFDVGSWHSDDRHDQETSRRYSPERDYPDQRYSDGEFVDQPRREEGHYREPPFDFGTKRGRSQERDERRWDDGPKADILDAPVGIGERWHGPKFRERGPDDEFFLREGEVSNPDMTRLNELMMKLPERRSLLDLGRIQPIPLSVGLGGHRRVLNQPLAHRLGAQLPRDGFQRGFSGLAIPLKEVPVSARMQGFVTRNQTNVKTNTKNLSLTKTVYQTKGDITLANLLLKSGIPNLQHTKGADLEKAAGNVPSAGTSTTDPNKGKSEGVQAVSGGKNFDGKTLSRGPRPKPLNPEANSIGNQCDILETLELQGFLYNRVMTLWTCYICRTSLKNGGAYKIHLISKNHVKTYNKLISNAGAFDCRKIAYALKNLPNHRTVTPEQLSAGDVNRMYFCYECGEGYSCTTLEHRKTERHLTLESHRRCCYLCNVYCSGWRALVKHQNSKLHITIKSIKSKDLLTKEAITFPGNAQNKAPISAKALVPSKVPVSGPKPVSSKPSDSSKTTVSNKGPVPTKKPIASKATTSNKSTTLIKELSSDMTENTAQNISGLQSERKSIKMTLKGTKTPATVTDSGQRTKEDGKVKEEKEEPIGLQSERKSIKMTLKGTKTPATGTDSGQSTKKDGKVKEEKEELIGLQSERKSIKMTLKGTKTPATVTDSGQRTKEDGKVKEEKEEPIGLDLVIPVTGFFCRCCSKFYNNKFMAERNHCMTAEHKQKALAWFKSHGTANPQKKPIASSERAAKSTPKKPVCPSAKPSQSEAIIVIDDDEDCDDVKGTPNEKQQPPQRQDKMDTGEPQVTTPARLGDKPKADATLTDSKLTPGALNSKEGNGKVIGHAGKSNESSKLAEVKVEKNLQPTDRPVERKLRAVRVQHKSSKDSDLEDGEIRSEEELSVNEQNEASMEKMETQIAEQPRDKTKDVPTIKMESGNVGQTIEKTVDPTSAEMEVKASDQTVRESLEPFSEIAEDTAEDQAIEETEEPLKNSGTDKNVQESVESHARKMAKPATDPSVEVTDTATSELDKMDTDQSVDIFDEPLIRETENVSDGPNSDMTTEPPNMELDARTTDLTVSSHAEPASVETQLAQAGGNSPSGGVSDMKEIEQPKEDVAETLVTADKDIGLTEEDLYADLVEHAPEAEMEDSFESREEQGNEQGNEQDDEMDDEEDTRFFIDEGTWEVRSEEEGSNAEPFDDDGILEGDDDELIVFEDEEDSNKDLEEIDNDTAS